MLTNKIINLLEKLPLYILIWILLCIRFVDFQLIGNEEQYFAFARHYMDPEWIEGAFPLQDFTGTRVIFETVSGFILQFVSFEIFAFFGRILVFLLLSIPLAKIIKYLNIPNYIFLFIFSVYIFKNQALFAHEWIFMGIEAKSFAYIFIFYGLYMMLKNKIYRAIIFISVATYFHALVGGWFLIYLIFYLLLEKFTLREIIKAGIFYFLITLPFIVFLFPVYINSSNSVVNDINTNWIYVYYRNPHHLAPFKSKEFFFDHFLLGVIISSVWLTLCITFFKKVNSTNFRRLNNIVISLLSFQLFFVFIAYFDKNGTLLKYYPFRSSALSFLLLLIEVVLYLRIKYSFHHIVMKKVLPTFKAIVLLCSLFLFIYYINLSFSNFLASKNSSKTNAVNVIAHFLKTNSSQNEVIMDLINNGETLSLLRKSERKLFVINKFVPTTPELLYEWYVRNEHLVKLRKNPSYIKILCKQYKIDYLLSSKKINSNYYKEIFSYNNYYLYEIECSR